MCLMSVMLLPFSSSTSTHPIWSLTQLWYLLIKNHRCSTGVSHPPYMVWPYPWEYSYWGRPFNQGSMSGRPHPGKRDRENTKTWSNSQAMDSALWSCDRTPPCHPGRADRRLGPSGQETGTFTFWVCGRCCTHSTLLFTSHMQSQLSCTCRWFWEVHKPRILHYPPD